MAACTTAGKKYLFQEHYLLLFYDELFILKANLYLWTNNTMRKYLLSILFLLSFFNIGAFSQDFTPYFPNLTAEDNKSLATDGELFSFASRADEIIYLPATSYRAVMLKDLEKLEPNVLVEAVFSMPNPDRSHLELYNQIRNLTSLTGVEYYSASRKRMRTLFNKVYPINNQKERKELPDPLVTRIPSSSKVIIKQDDTTFGESVQELTYLYDGEVIVLTMKNLTNLFYGIIPIVDPKKLVIHAVIIPAEDNLYFYGFCGAKTFSLFGLEMSRTESFYNRLKALFNWFRRD